MSFNTQPRGGGCNLETSITKFSGVSTHSRAEAAATTIHKINILRPFQHTAARRRLQKNKEEPRLIDIVSTHSRAEAAACAKAIENENRASFNTQPRGGGCFFI